MPVVASDPNMDPNEKDKEASGSASVPVNVSGTSAPTNVAAPSATPAATSSGRFQNLQSYLKANEGYNQGKGLAGQVDSTLTGKQQTQVDNYSQDAQRVQGQAQEAGRPFESTSSYLQQAFADPTKVANDPNAMAQWQQYYNGSYAAPKAYDANGQLAQGQNQFQQTAALTKTEPGRMGLLQKFYGNPGYTAGQQQLDNLFMQGNSSQLSQLQNNAKDLSQQVGSAYVDNSAQSQAALDALKANAASASQATQSGLTNNISNEQVALSRRASDEQAKREGMYNGLLDHLTRNTLTPEEISKLGLTSGQPIYNLNMADYLKNTVGQVGVGNVANASDQAKFQALAKLSGQPLESELGQWANPTNQLANPYTLDTNALNAAIASMPNVYNSAANDAMLKNYTAAFGAPANWDNAADRVAGLKSSYDALLAGKSLNDYGKANAAAYSELLKKFTPTRTLQ